jgi:hypothetical protein
MANEREITITINADGTAAISTMRNLGDATQKFGNQTSSISSTIQKNWVSIAAGMTAAYLALQKFISLTEAAAEHAERIETLDALTRQYGTTAAGIVSKIQEVSHGLIGQSMAAKVASDAIVKGFNPEQIAQMAQIAVVLKKTSTEGISTSEAFRTLEGSITAARERGVVKMFGANIDLASSMGAVYENMSKAEKATAILNAVSEQASKVQRILGENFDSNADKLERLKNQIEALKRTLGDYLLRLAAGLMATAQSISAAVLWLTRVVMAPIQTLMIATDYLGLTSGKAEQYRQDMEALGAAAWDLAEKANANFDIARGKEDAAKKAGSGERTPGAGGDENLKRAEKLNEAMRKIREENALAEAADIEKAKIRDDAWFDEQVKKLKELGANDAQFSELVRAYAAKRHQSIATEATRQSDFYIAEQRRLTEEAVKLEKERAEAITKEQVLAAETRLKNEAATLTAWGADPSVLIRAKAAGEREILAIKERGLIDTITENTTFQDTLAIMAQVRAVQVEIEESKRREVNDLDVRRVEIQREIAELTRQQGEMLKEQAVSRVQDALNSIGAPKAGALVGLVGQMEAGIDPYTKDYERFAEMQNRKLMLLEEQGNKQAEINEAVNELIAQGDAKREQQRLAIAQSGFGMMAGMAQAFYAASNSKSLAAFRAYQAFSIAEAIVGTYRAAVSAYAFGAKFGGPVLGAAFAAAAIAAGMAQVQAIASQKPGGAATASVGGGGTPAIPGATGTQEKEQETPAVPTPIYNVYVYGNVVDHDAFARELVPALEKARSDGAR